MSAPTNFSFVRDTPNFRLFTGHNPNTGQPVSIWLPWGIITGVDKFAAYVNDVDASVLLGVEPNGTRLRCCYRDNDQDGNCQVHSAPGVLRDGWMEHDGKIMRTAVFLQQNRMRSYADQYRFDRCPKPFAHNRQMDMYKYATSHFNDIPVHETPAVLRELNRRLERAEGRINILWKFAEKVIKILKHFRLDRRSQ